MCVYVCVCHFHSSSIVNNAAGMNLGVQMPPGIFLKSFPWDVEYAVRIEDH